jgi:hypothetical protein
VGLVIFSKLLNVYHAKTGDFVFPGSNAYNDKKSEKLEKSKDILEMIECGHLTLTTTKKDETVEVKYEDDDTYKQTSAKAVMEMNQVQAIKFLDKCINLAVLDIVSKEDTRGNISQLAKSRFDAVMAIGKPR